MTVLSQNLCMMKCDGITKQHTSLNKENWVFWSHAIGDVTSIKRDESVMKTWWNFSSSKQKFTQFWRITHIKQLILIIWIDPMQLIRKKRIFYKLIFFVRLTLQLLDLEFGHYSKRSFWNDSTSNIMNVCFIDSSWIQLIYLIRRMKVAKTHYSLINCRMLQQRKPITNRSLNLDSVWALSSVLVFEPKDSLI